MSAAALQLPNWIPFTVNDIVAAGQATDDCTSAFVKESEHGDEIIIGFHTRRQQPYHPIRITGSSIRFTNDQGRTQYELAANGEGLHGLLQLLVAEQNQRQSERQTRIICSILTHAVSTATARELEPT